MDLFRIDPALRKPYSDRSAPLTRADATTLGTRNDLTKQFTNSEILSSSAWSSVIHQPAQDSEPEDLPSTVDIDAIKEPPTPVNASAQTPARQLGESNSFEFSDDQNAAESGTDSDSESDSANSENEVENTASGADSGSYSDSDSASSRRSSSSSKCKQSSRSSRSNTPPCNYENQPQFSVRETNFEQGGLKLKFSALKVPKFGTGGHSDYVKEDADNSSDSSESKGVEAKKKPRYDPVLKTSHKWLKGPKTESRYKSSLMYRPQEEDRFDASDSDSSSSSYTSPVKRTPTRKFLERDFSRPNFKLDYSSNRLKISEPDNRAYFMAKEKKYDKVESFSSCKKKEIVKNMVKDRLTAPTVDYAKHRNKSVFPLPTLKLPQACKLSEDSDDSEDMSEKDSKSIVKKENNRDTIEKLAQQLTHPGISSEHLQVLNQEDLAAVLPEVNSNANGSGEFELADGTNGRRKTSLLLANKKTALSESSSDSEMLPKQDQIVRDAINSIHVDSDVSNDSGDSSSKQDSSDDSSSSDDEDEKPEEKGKYKSNLLEVFAEKTEQLSKNTVKPKNKTSYSSSSLAKTAEDRKTNSSETLRKRGRPPKSKISSMAEIEAYMRLDCTVSNVSPDSGIQSNCGSPLYHGLQSPASYNITSRAGVVNHKPSASASNLKSLSLSQKAVLCASKKNSQKNDSRERKETTSSLQVLRNQTNQIKCTKNETGKKSSTKDGSQKTKNGKAVVDSVNIDDLIKVPPYLGSKTVSRNVNPAVHGNLNLFQGKRGPGRPKKHIQVTKLNGKTNSEKVYSSKVDTYYDKSLDVLSKVQTAPNNRSTKSNYIDPVAVGLENSKKRKRKKNEIPSFVYRTTTTDVKNRPVSAPLYPAHKEWLHRHKKHKKKDVKEKAVNLEFLKELDNLTEIFNKKCLIEDKKLTGDINSQFLHSVIMRSKSIHRLKDRSSKKRKHSDKDSESETNSAVSIITSDTKTKRRHKKNAIEIPKVSQTNCDQRLPLKKRHYHISTSSTTSSGHPPHSDSKVRNDKHSTSSDPTSSLSLSFADTSAIKSSSKTGGAVKVSENQKYKPEIPKHSAKTETLKPGPKVETSKSGSSRLEVCRSSVKVESSKHSSKSDTSKHAGKGTVELVTTKQITSKSENQKPTKVDALKKDDGKGAEKSTSVPWSSADSENGIVVTPKKRHRLEEEKKPASKTDNSILPLRRSERCVNQNVTKSDKAKKSKQKNDVQKKSSSTNSGSQERAKKSTKTVTAKVAEVVNQENVTKRVEPVKVDCAAKKTERKSSMKAEENQNSSNKSNKSSKYAETNKETVKEDLAEENCNDEPVSKIKSPELRRTPPPLSPTRVDPLKSVDVIVEATAPVLEEYLKQTANEHALVDDLGLSLPSIVINKLQTPHKPQLITPLPSEPTSVATSPSLKPPAGVFEPSRKLPTSITRCKKNSIDDVLSKLKEKLKGLDTPMKNTSALIEKIGVGKNDAEPVRVLRPKRASTEKENINTKKNKLGIVTVRLRKLSNSELCSMPNEELKPKVKRRKVRNKTGFPVKKKKKVKRMHETNERREDDENVTTLPEEVKPPNIVSEECSQISKNERSESNDCLMEDDIPLAQRTAPVLQPINENTSVKVKDEAMDEDEGKSKKSAEKKKPEKILKSDSSNRLLPSRVSARIYIKKQMRARELKKSSQKKKISKKPFAVALEHEKRESRSKIVEKESKTKIETKKEIADVKSKVEVENDLKSEDEKESKSKEETDKDELSDDSVKCGSSKKDVIPKRRVKCVPAGLFSDYYKEEKCPTVDPKNRFTAFKPEDHPCGLLPPPPYFEDWVRRRQVDFKLPFDLWWLHKHDQLPGRDIVESWKYKRIRLNVYYDVKPTNVYETQACNCKMPEEEDKLGCGEDCINRVVYAECSPDLCPLKEKCSNQRIQKHDGDKRLVKFMTPDKGIGVKTEKPIRCGEYILEYVGEVVTDKEFKKRMTSLYKNDIHHYCLNLDGGLVIDGHRMGGDGRFVNHSCEPNCEIQKWTVNGLFRMALFAQRDIEAGEELTYDYNFALFNPEEGQKCLCGSANCRGVIGGKSQRVSVANSNAPSADSVASANSNVVSNQSSNKKSRVRPRKQICKSTENVHNQRRRDSETSTNSIGVLPHRNVQHSIPVKPLTPEEKTTVKIHRLFLPRNLNKVQRVREKLNKENSNNSMPSDKMRINKSSAEFLRQLNALSQERLIRTRGLAQVEDDPEMTKTLQLASILRIMYNDIVSAKDERDEKSKPYSSLFMTLPSKRKLPMYYTRIGDPIDLTTIEKKIISGVYKNVESFDADVNKLINNNVTYYGRITDYGIAAVNLRKAYNIAKMKYAAQLQDIIGQTLPTSFMMEQKDPGDEEEDVIRCICGLYNDEGLMIQCERCLVWQHCDCVRADTNAEDYLCERCNPRDVDYDIPLDVDPPDYPKPDEKHYLTLMRDDLQIRQGDAVYVLRSIINPETGLPHTFRTIKNFRYEDCDIFRVEQLWKTKEGERFSFGHHYLRPHETFHEPSRKFFPNEVLKVPLYETVPLNLIMGRCHVLDVLTYCKGKPVDADPQHIYICEYRVDKEAKSFYKIPKSKQYSVCTKNYAFEKYDPRLKPSRTYAPHGDPKPTIGAGNNTIMGTTVNKSTNNQKPKHSKTKESCASVSTESNRLSEMVTDSSCNSKVDESDTLVTRLKDSKVEKQKQRLNLLLRKMLAKKSTKAPLDASYLLLDMGRRNRKKTNNGTQIAST